MLENAIDALESTDRYASLARFHALWLVLMRAAHDQGMGWSLLPVFGPDGQLSLSETVTFQPIYRYRPEARYLTTTQLFSIMSVLNLQLFLYASDSHFFGAWADQAKVKELLVSAFDHSI